MRTGRRGAGGIGPPCERRPGARGGHGVAEHQGAVGRRPPQDGGRPSPRRPRLRRTLPDSHPELTPADRRLWSGDHPRGRGPRVGVRAESDGPPRGAGPWPSSGSETSPDAVSGVEQTDTAGAHLSRREAGVIPVRLMPTDDCRGAEGETAADHSGSGPSPHIGAMNCALCDQHFPVHDVPCAGTQLLLPIHARPRTSYRRVLWTGRRPCSECATSPASPHHMPCEREYCPACGDGQRLISCHAHFLWTALPSPTGRGVPSG
jgi:hypothetical protein